jgi:hypothetical protein
VQGDVEFYDEDEEGADGEDDFDENEDDELPLETKVDPDFADRSVKPMEEDEVSMEVKPFES